MHKHLRQVETAEGRVLLLGETDKGFMLQPGVIMVTGGQ